MANPRKSDSQLADRTGRPMIGAAQALIADQATTAATQTSPWGFASQAQADALATKINAILDVLEAHGLMKDA